MKTVPAASIQIRDRQRNLDRGNVESLKASILTKGLLHPLVLSFQDGGPILVAGMHRMVAMQELHEAGQTFSCDGAGVPKDEVPYISVSEMSAADLLEAELEENIIRVAIPWQDKARALAAIHELRAQDDPGRSYTKTANEVVKQSQGRVTFDVARAGVKGALLLKSHLHDPDIAKSRNFTEAVNKVLKKEQARVEAIMIKRRESLKKSEDVSESPRLIEVRHDDMANVFPILEDHKFDLIIADLPYGIAVGSAGFRNRSVEHHNYDDSIGNAKRLLRFVLTEGFRLCKPRANLFIFGDVDLFPLFKEAAAAMAWVPFRTPIIWRKSNEGLAPWGTSGFRRTYEMIFYATKGSKGLYRCPTDVLDAKRVSRSARRYGAEKPVELMEQLLECATMPNDYVLDPCCGSGSSLIAARHMGRRALGIELDEHAYNLSLIAAERDPTDEEFEEFEPTLRSEPEIVSEPIDTRENQT